jgi:HAMP domain-containing protein
MNQVTKPPTRSIFLSLRIKLLLIFTLLFTFAFAAIFLWFYNFATALAMDNLRKDLIATALTAAAGIDGDAYTRLYQSGQMDDATYTAIAEVLRSVKRAHPKAAGIYTYVQLPGESDQVHFVVSAALPPEVAPSPRDVALSRERLSGCTVPPSSRPAMGQSYGWADGLSPTMLNGARQPGAETELWADEWGKWLSGYAPIYNADGKPVGAVGVDMCAADVTQLQQNIRRTILPVFGLTLAVLAGVVFALAHGVTRPIIALTRAADRIGQGDYEQDLTALHSGLLRDEVATLAEVFELMVGKVYQREQTLRRQLEVLKIEVDEVKRQKQVSEIVETDFFQDLQAKARSMRSRRRGAAPETSDDAS